MSMVKADKSYNCGQTNANILETITRAHNAEYFLWFCRAVSRSGLPWHGNIFLKSSSPISSMLIFWRLTPIVATPTDWSRGVQSFSNSPCLKRHLCGWNLCGWWWNVPSKDCLGSWRFTFSFSVQIVHDVVHNSITVKMKYVLSKPRICRKW